MLAEPSDRSDVVVLRAPRGRGSLPVIRVVIGGMASRHALPVDRLDDVELAVETLFQEEPPGGEDFTLRIAVASGNFTVTLGGLCSPLVLKTLSGAAADADRLGPENILRMIMDALLDGYQTVSGPGAASFAVQMEKRIG